MLIPMPSTREEWLALRGKRIGASEVAALFDVQPAFALSRFALWHIKSGRAPSPIVEGPRLEWGLKLEEVIATAAAETNGWTVRKGRYAICDDCDGLAASLDFEIEADPEQDGPGVLETKNTDWLAHRRSWTDDEPPPHILLQLQAQLACTGYSWGAIAALVGGNDLRVYRYAARPALIASIKKRVAEFWQSIADDKPPPVDGSDSASHVLSALFAEVRDEGIDMRENNEWSEACAEFLAAQRRKKEAGDAYDLAKNRLAELLQDYKRGWGGGYSASIVVTPAVPKSVITPAMVGQTFGGRAESRRYQVKVQEQAV